MRKFVLICSVAVCATVFAAAAAAENYPYRSDYLWVTTPDHNDWLYKCGETPVVGIQLYRNGVAVENQNVSYTIADDMLEADTDGRITVRKGKATLKVVPRGTPGFRDLRLSFNDPETGEVVSHHIKLGFDVGDIRPYTDEPEDFMDFWNRAVDQAREWGPSPVVVEKLPDVDGVELSLVKLRIDRNHYMYGYLSKPSGESSCPVVLNGPGAGIKSRKPDLRASQKGLIRLSVEIHGIDPRLDDTHYEEIATAFCMSGGHYFLCGLNNRDYAYLKHVYVGMVRCIDYLTSLSEWDGRNVIVEGGSQGGALSLVAAGLDSRVTHCIANYPAYADMAAGVEKGRTGGYPHLEKLPGFLTQEVLETLPYYDVVNFARHVRARTYMLWGYNDDVCPPTTSYAVWNVLDTEKTCRIVPLNEHWHSNSDYNVEYDWIVNNLVR